MADERSILIVDDDESTRRSLSLILGKSGYVVETAATGQEALERIQQSFFNLALLDIKLPDMQGVELVAPMKEHHPDMVVILATAYASLETAVQALNAGASAYITKPLNMDEVLPTFREALEKQHLVIENRRLYLSAQQELKERKRVERALRQRTAQLETLRQVALELTARLDLDDLLRSIVLQAVDLLEGDAGGFCLYRPDQDVVEWVVATGPSLAPVGTVAGRGKGLAGRILESGSPHIENDYRFKAGGEGEEEEASTVVGVPVRWGEEFLGVTLVQSLSSRTFATADAELLGLLVNQAAIAIKNAQLFNSLDQEKERLELLYRLGQHLSESLNVRDVAQRALDDACAVVGATQGMALICEPSSKGNLKLVAVHGYEPDVVDWYNQEVGPGGGLAHWVAVERHATLVVDTHLDSRWSVVPGMDDWVRSVLSVPLVSRSDLQGVISIYSDQVGAFKEEHLRLVESAAASVAAAVANARLYEQARRRALEQETLREAALAVTTALNRDEVIEHILAQLQEVVPYDSASVQLFRGDRMEIVGGLGFSNLSDLVGRSFPVDDDSPNSVVCRTRAPFIVEDASLLSTEFHQGVSLQTTVRSWLGVPMLFGDRLTGMIALDKCEEGFYTAEHAQLAEAFATQAAIAIDNSRLFEAEREQRELAEALAEAAAAVSSTLNLDQVLDLILEQVERVVLGDASNIMLIEKDTVRIARRRGYEELGVQAQAEMDNVALDRYPSLIRMVGAGKPVVVSDTASDPDWVSRKDQEWLRSYVGTPVRVAGKIVGFLNVDGARPGQFGPADARRLQAFADQAAAAIENAQLYRELLNYAEHLEDRVSERTEQLQAQYARLEAILSSASDGIVVADRAGDILQANPVADAWLNRDLLPRDANRLQRAIQELAQRAVERPEAMLAMTGLDLELKVSPISGPGAEEAAAVVAIHDVSHLTALDRMKTRFVSNVSHELRTPITTIKLYAELMRRQPERWEEYLEILTQEAERQARLVGDILQVSRIDAGRLEMDPRPICLNDLIETVVENHQALAQESDLSLKHLSAPDSPTVHADPSRIGQVLNNLVVNAIRYTPAGGEVVISTGMHKTGDRAWATATVQDTGVGIPDEELPHIFERFYRGEIPRQMQVPGTGLGLAIVKEIVELHGGQVTVESQVETGSTFTVWLPLKD